MINLMSLPKGIKLEVSKEDLIAFADHILMDSNKSNIPEKIVDEFISMNEVMELTGLARQTIYGRVSKGTIPYYKAEDGKRLRFKKIEIIEWMKSGKKKSEEEIQQEVENYINSSKGKKRKW